MTDAWLGSRGHLPRVYEVLIESPEAWSQPLAKFKTPADYIYSSYRALGLPLRGEAPLAASLRGAGPTQPAAGLACRLA
jgi:uncharacterized protein (DUF1800 family)